MTAEIRVRPTEDVVRVVVRGELTTKVGNEAMAAAVRQAREADCFRLLLDFRQAHIPQEESLYHQLDLRRRFGIRHTDRIALLCLPEDIRCQSIENDAIDAGLLLRVFQHENNAVAWLQGRRRLFPRLWRRWSR